MSDEEKVLEHPNSLSDGEKVFGPFVLFWEVRKDGLDWGIYRQERPSEVYLVGFLKYVGWADLSTDEIIQEGFYDDEIIPASFRFYAYEWPSVKEALDYLFYTLGKKVAVKEGKYLDAFEPPSSKG